MHFFPIKRHVIWLNHTESIWLKPSVLWISRGLGTGAGIGPWCPPGVTRSSWCVHGWDGRWGEPWSPIPKTCLRSFRMRLQRSCRLGDCCRLKDCWRLCRLCRWAEQYRTWSWAIGLFLLRSKHMFHAFFLAPPLRRFQPTWHGKPSPHWSSLAEDLYFFHDPGFPTKHIQSAPSCKFGVVKQQELPYGTSYRPMDRSDIEAGCRPLVGWHSWVCRWGVRPPGRMKINKDHPKPPTGSPYYTLSCSL